MSSKKRGQPAHLQRSVPCSLNDDLNHWFLICEKKKSTPVVLPFVYYDNDRPWKNPNYVPAKKKAQVKSLINDEMALKRDGPIPDGLTQEEIDALPPKPNCKLSFLHINRAVSLSRIRHVASSTSDAKAEKEVLRHHWPYCAVH